MRHIIKYKSGGGGRLPEGYTELEYIKSSGTQYIDTGIIGRYNTSAHIKFSSNGDNDNDLLGCYDGTNRVYLVADVNNDLRIGYGAPYSVNKTISTDVIYEYTASVADGLQTFVTDGTQTYTGSISGAINTNKNMYLFLRNQNGTVRTGGSGFAIYFCEIYQDSTLVRNFIPAKNSSNVIGMYDLVNNQFYTNSGTGTFTPGPESTGSTVQGLVCTKSGERHNLPSGYTELEYIQSIGTQYIDTGITAESGLTIECSFKAQDTKQCRLIGASDGASTRYSLLTSSSTGVIVNQYGDINKLLDDYVLDLNFHALKNMNGALYYDGVLVDSTPAQTFNIGRTFYLFASNSATTITYSYVQIFNCKILNGETLVRNFIPAKNSSNVLGMYDTVTNTFFTNAGTGTFIQGPEVVIKITPHAIKTQEAN